MVAPAVFHFLLSLKFGDYGLGRQFSPISSHILGVAHLCHAEKMEFLVAAINEIHKFGTCEPAVNQQVIERYLVAYRILHHIQQLDTLAHDYPIRSLPTLFIYSASTHSHCLSSRLCQIHITICQLCIFLLPATISPRNKYIS